MNRYIIESDDDLQCQVCHCDFREGQEVKQLRLRSRKINEITGRWENLSIKEEFYCLTCAERYLYHCDCCGNIKNSFNNPFTRSRQGLKYCKHCTETRLSQCCFCQDFIDRYHSPSTPEDDNGDSKPCCSECWEERFYHCPRCRSTVDANNIRECMWENELTELCENCHHEETELRGGNKHFRTEKLDLSDNTFKHLRLNRCFGVELEIDCDNIPFTTIRDNTTFGSKYDGSIGETGSEFYSPILQGDKGYNQIKKFCDLVKGFKVSTRTGYHLHLDARDLRETQAKKIWLMYNLFEGVLFGMLPRSRKDNDYCKPSKVSPRFIANSFDLQEDWYSQQQQSDEDWGHHYNSTRYLGCNLHSYYFQKTIEVRYHSGTVDFIKIINWIKINQYIFKYALEHSKEEILKLKNFGSSKTNYTRIRKLFKEVVPNKSLWKYYKKRFNKFNDSFDKKYGWYREIPEELREQRNKELKKREQDRQNTTFLNGIYHQECLGELPRLNDVDRGHRDLERQVRREEDEIDIYSNWRSELDRERRNRREREQRESQEEESPEEVNSNDFEIRYLGEPLEQREEVYEEVGRLEPVFYAYSYNYYDGTL